MGWRIVYVVVAVAVLAAGAGAAVSIDHWRGRLAALGGSASPSSLVGQGGTDRDAGSLVTSALVTSALAARVDPGIVDIISSSLGGDPIGAGTGMVISSSGLVLTNNHVIDGAASLSATLVTTGKTYSARVIGYDSTDDVALLQLVGASGLKPVTLSDSGKAKVGEAVLGIGNAGGKGGLPSTARGAIVALGQSIEVTGEDTPEYLHGMIAMDAPIRPGDSGGPLVNGTGAVVGMDTAGDAAGSAVNFAIPVNAAMSIVRQISAGKASTTVHLGLAAYLGVTIDDASSRHACESGQAGLGFHVSSPVSSGALICETDPYGPASQISTGLLETGDVIVSVNGKTIGSAADLTALTAAARPGDAFAIDYVDPDGAMNSVSVTLTGMAR